MMDFCRFSLDRRPAPNRRYRFLPLPTSQCSERQHQTQPGQHSHGYICRKRVLAPYPSPQTRSCRRAKRCQKHPGRCQRARGSKAAKPQSSSSRPWQLRCHADPSRRPPGITRDPIRTPQPAQAFDAVLMLDAGDSVTRKLTRLLDDVSLVRFRDHSISPPLCSDRGRAGGTFTFGVPTQHTHHPTPQVGRDKPTWNGLAGSPLPGRSHGFQSTQARPPLA